MLHGTACAEVINGVSPGVQMHCIYSGATKMDLLKVLEDMETDMNAKGEQIDVILCPLDFFVGRFDGDDDICQAIEAITSKGTIWINSAGNMAKKHWSGDFTDPDGDGFMNFRTGDESINISAEAGDTLTIWLSWDDQWGNATQDYDLYIKAPNGRHPVYSASPQWGIYGHRPVETVTTEVARDGKYEVIIKDYNSTRNVHFHLFSTHDLDEYAVQNSSLGVIACCDEVIAVGSLDPLTLGLEPDSSRGSSMDGWIKPDIVALDNVETMTYYSPYIARAFKGTSASASYVAGCIALAIDALGYSGQGLKDLLLERSTDLGPKGPDNQYGHGLINLSTL
jgi:hypothetical protein